MRSAIKYQDKHKNGVIFVTSYTHFSTLFLQEKHQVESSEFRSAHDVSPYDYTFTFTGKEKDAETAFSYFGARYYDSDLSGMFLSVDPMADKYPSISPYAYCAWNPVKLVDPDGMTWKDIDGNVITDHSKIKVYIFYDPKSFESQSFQMYNDAIEKYGEGSVALSDVTTERDFVQDRHDMGGNDIQEVNLNYHGSNQAIHLNYETDDYIWKYTISWEYLPKVEVKVNTNISEYIGVKR